MVYIERSADGLYRINNVRIYIYYAVARSVERANCIISSFNSPTSCYASMVLQSY